MKKLSLYEKINDACSKGFYPIVKTPGGDYLIVSPHKDGDGDWRESGLCDSIEEASKTIGVGYGADADAWSSRENQGWQYIGFYAPPIYGRFEPGDKVRVRENAKQRCEAVGVGWNDNKGNMVGKVCEIERKYSPGHRVFTPDKSDWWLFPTDALEPVYEPEAKDTINIGGKEYEVTDELKTALNNLKEV